MRIALAIALVGVLVSATAASARNTASGVPHGFQPETAAAVGAHDLWLLGDGALLRSTDGGEEFARVGLPPFPSQGDAPDVVFANARDGFAYVEGSTPLYVTHDGGESWHRAGPRRDVSAFAAAAGFAYVVSGRHELERSRVSQDAWQRSSLAALHLPFSLAARGSDVWFLGPPRHRPDYDTLALSSDHGRTFTPLKGPCLAELGGALVPAADGVVWAVCPCGMMARSRSHERRPFVPSSARSTIPAGSTSRPDQRRADRCSSARGDPDRGAVARSSARRHGPSLESRTGRLSTASSGSPSRRGMSVPQYCNSGPGGGSGGRPTAAQPGIPSPIR